VGGSIFAAISLVISLLTDGYLPEVPWGLQWFDPVSIIWILSFFIFGYEAGILTSTVGMVLLFITDEYAAYLGPLFKFLATVPLIVVPLIIEKLRKHPLTSEHSLNLKNLVFNWIIAVVVRLVIMMGFNLFAVLVLFADDFSGLISSLSFGSLSGLAAFLILVVLINFLQSISDYLIPSALVKPIQAGIPNLIPW
jgi:riboflavin transporter FmnP